MDSMDHRHLRAACIAGALMLGMGCDEEAPPPVSSSVEQVENEPVSQPANLPVDEQARVRLPLNLIPFSVQAPESWKVESFGAGETPITMVEAPLVGDEIKITLGLREPVGGEVLRNMIKRYEKEDAELKKNGGGVSITEAGDLRIIDFRRMPANATTVPAEQQIDWRITLLYPRGVMHEQYTLQFIGLSVETYEKNKALLNDVVKSIKYDDSGLTPLPKGF
jgi:hypothetical protein